MDTMTHETTVTPRLLSVDQATALLGVGRTTVYELMTSRALASVKVGRRRLIPADAIDAFVKALAA